MVLDYFTYAVSLIPDIVGLVNFDLGAGFTFLHLCLGLSVMGMLVRSLLFRVPFGQFTPVRSIRYEQLKHKNKGGGN